MKKMNGRILHLEEGVPEAECGTGWMRETLLALRAWERRNGIAAGGFRGMNGRLWKGRRKKLKTEHCPAHAG